jgi:hypothetical protein
LKRVFRGAARRRACGPVKNLKKQEAEKCAPYGAETSEIRRNSQKFSHYSKKKAVLIGGFKTFPPLDIRQSICYNIRPL